MDAYVIVGRANTRKSSVARSLTGCFNRSFRDILTTSGSVLDFYVRVSSLQESATTEVEFENEVLSTGRNHVLFCLWPQTKSTFPNADTYLSYFQSRSWNIHKIAVLGESANPLTISVPANTTQIFTNSRTDPINQTAREVRKHFEFE